MAKIIENKKGFKVIELSLPEVNKTWGSVGICDCCNKVAFSFKYIAVLNNCYCPKCYDDFKENATYYPEDSWLEDKNFEEIKKKLNL